MRLFYCFAITCFFAAGQSLDAIAQSPSDSIKQLSVATSMDREGMKPWHLRMSFDLYDLKGKKSESGSIEEWWASPTSHRIVIESPSYHFTAPSTGSENSSRASREAYLVHNLLSQVVNPIPQFNATDAVKVEEQSKTFSKVPLSCFDVSTTTTYQGHKTTNSGPVYCTEPGKDILRIHFDTSEGMTIVRNHPGHFQGASVALDNSISYNEKMAIEGHVETLETFDPQKSPVELQTDSHDAKAIPGVVLAGKALSKYPPDYPLLAKQKHIGGTVILCAIISKQGTISSLDVASSPDELLSASAMEAVKRWTYTPYLLNGEPTEVDTTITVHYNINGG